MAKVLVIGDVMLDIYVNGEANSISAEAPVAIFKTKDKEYRLGGASNVANNLVSLNCECHLFGVIGKDNDGEILQNLLKQKHIKEHCYLSNRVTTTKTRIISSKHQMIRIDHENSHHVESSLLEKMFLEISSMIDEIDCIILSDYLKGVLTPHFCEKIIKLANEKNKIILCDPKGKDYTKYTGATLLTPNKKEASIATGVDIIDDESLKNALINMHDKLNLKYALITISEDGIAFLDDNKNLIKSPTIAKEVYDVSGAGDTVIAALALQLCAKNDLSSAVEFANIAAGIVVGKLGSATVSLEEIHDFIALKHSSEKISIDDKIFQHISNFNVNVLKNQKIVMTNGCFDILHIGHIRYLAKAKELGDILIVALNGDESISRLKGMSRPINNVQDRAIMLSALYFVDFVIIFNEDTPIEVIKTIKPDILVKGADYEGKQVAGAEYAKELKLLEFIKGKSSTAIIEKIKNLKD